MLVAIGTSPVPDRGDAERSTHQRPSGIALIGKNLFGAVTVMDVEVHYQFFTIEPMCLDGMRHGNRGIVEKAKPMARCRSA